MVWPRCRSTARFYHHFDVTGLAIASDIGILMHTFALAWLLDRKKLVTLAECRGWK